MRSTTGWFDDGIIQGGLNRLVPTISFRLENTAAIEIRSVQINGVFRRVGEEEEWGNAFVRVVGTEGLPSGSLTSPIVLESDLGYTGEEPRLEMVREPALRGRRGGAVCQARRGAMGEAE